MSDNINKTEQQFQENFKTLIALLKGEDIFNSPKVDNSEVSTLVEELIKERKAEVISEFKEKAKKILNTKIEFDKEVEKLEQELRNKINQKQQEFISSMKEIFKLVDNVKGIETSYYASIEQVKESKESKEFK